MTSVQVARGIHEVPEYRERSIRRAMKWANASTYEYWQEAWKDTHKFWVQDSTGIVYCLDTRYSKDAFFTPHSDGDAQWAEVEAMPGHKLDGLAPLICQCGNDRLQVWYPEQYETKARCPECRRSDTIASG